MKDSMLRFVRGVLLFATVLNLAVLMLAYVGVLPSEIRETTWRSLMVLSVLTLTIVVPAMSKRADEDQHEQSQQE